MGRPCLDQPALSTCWVLGPRTSAQHTPSVSVDHLLLHTSFLGGGTQARHGLGSLGLPYPTMNSRQVSQARTQGPLPVFFEESLDSHLSCHLPQLRVLHHSKTQVISHCPDFHWLCMRSPPVGPGISDPGPEGSFGPLWLESSSLSASQMLWMDSNLLRLHWGPLGT